MWETKTEHKEKRGTDEKRQNTRKISWNWCNNKRRIEKRTEEKND